MKNRAALYLRVSTKEQTLENQRPDLERIVQTRGLDVVTIYEESASAAKKRPEFDRMMRDAHRGQFDTLVIWALDRFGRSMANNIRDVLELDRVGVQIVSVQEAWLDTGGPVRQLLLAIFSWVAEEERARLIERTIAGQERARREGKRIGRPKTWFNMAKAHELLAAGNSLRGAAKLMKVPYATFARAVARKPLPPVDVEPT